MKKLKYLTLALTFIVVLFSCGDDDQLVDLPQSITDYITSNYPDYEIDESELEPACTGEDVYEVEIESSNDDELELTFDSKGNFLYSETEIGNGSLPTTVTNSISTNYGIYTTEESERLDMADGTTRFEVELKDGSSQLEVIFDTEGNVICEGMDDE